MKAKVIKRFRGVEDGGIYPKTFNPGDVIFGSLAVAEINSGRAVSLEKKPPLNKAEIPERNKHSLSSPQGQALPKKTVKRSKGRAKLSLSTTPTK